MNTLLPIVILISISATNCLNDFLVVYDGNANSFYQIYLDKSKKVNLTLKSSDEDHKRIVIIEQQKDDLNLYYDHLEGIGIYQTGKKEKQEKYIGFPKSDPPIHGFDKKPSSDVYYLFSDEVIYQWNASNPNELVWKIQAEGGHFIHSISYDSNKGIIYYMECKDPKEGGFLKEFYVNNGKPGRVINTDICFKKMYFDHSADQIFGVVLGDVIYNINFGVENPKVEIFYERKGAFMNDFTVGSRHVYVSVALQGLIYSIEKNQNKTLDLFYTVQNGELNALAIHEEKPEHTSTASRSTSLNFNYKKPESRSPPLSSTEKPEPTSRPSSSTSLNFNYENSEPTSNTSSSTKKPEPTFSPSSSTEKPESTSSPSSSSSLNFNFENPEPTSNTSSSTSLNFNYKPTSPPLTSTEKPEPSSDPSSSTKKPEPTSNPSSSTSLDFNYEKPEPTSSPSSSTSLNFNYDKPETTATTSSSTSINFNLLNI